MLSVAQVTPVATAATMSSAAFAEEDTGPAKLDDQWQRQQKKVRVCVCVSGERAAAAGRSGGRALSRDARPVSMAMATRALAHRRPSSFPDLHRLGQQPPAQAQHEH